MTEIMNKIFKALCTEEATIKEGKSKAEQESLEGTKLEEQKVMLMLMR